MKVPYIDLGAQWLDIEEEALSEISRILRGGKAIGDPVIEQLEDELSKYLKIEHCISLNSGTDALLIGLMCLGIGKGDEVITVANSFIASTAAIVHIGAVPRFVDVAEDHLIDPELIESAVSSRTRAIMPVHLEGKMCNMLRIQEIAEKYNLKVIEDAAQSFGSSHSSYQPGQLSDLACFSFHPLKNLNGSGDGGFIATNSEAIASRAKILKNHGLIDRDTSHEFGMVSRLDSIQAAILRIRLKSVDDIILKRRNIASIYNSLIINSKIQLPLLGSQSNHTYHLYVIEIDSRDKIQNQLEVSGIQTKIHYPKLICDQPAYLSRFGSCKDSLEKTRAQANRILSIPIHQNLSDEQVKFVISALNKL